MAQIQAIKRRIRSVSSTKQITKAMELVSASKMRKAQEATLKSRAFRNSARAILTRLAQLSQARSFPYFAKRKVKNRLYVVFTSDRGLAGAYNSNVLKLFMHKLQNDKEAGVNTKAIVIGRKGSNFASRIEDLELVGVYDKWPDAPSSADIQPIIHTAMSSFLHKNVDEVVLLYTEFVSSINQIAKTEILLPAKLEKLDSNEQNDDVNNSEFEPSVDSVVNLVVPRLIESQLYQAVLEAIASEHSMRMMAMKNATDNANELTDDLTLAYNSARQASITQELAEITGGAAAIN